MKFRSAFAVLAMSVAVTACGELPFQKNTPEEAPAVEKPAGPPAVSPIDSPIETGEEGRPLATAEANTANIAMFRAAGAGWTVTANNSRAVYERSGAKSTAVSVRRMTYARGVEFIGTMNGSVFSLNVQAAECQAGDVKTPFTAKLRVGSQRLSGCAAATDTMPKAQVTASSAAPKPKSTAKPKPAAAPVAKPADPATTTPSTATTPAPAATETAPATTAPVTSTPLAPAVTTPAPAAETPAATPAPATTPAPAATTTPEAPAATTPSDAPATSGVPAPQLILPPTPPATTQ
ncbi:hypothetical protein [Paracoccus aestuariivivens]|uniref:Uncharacterized protein n=1 Tax=Paracoccus aestuariivivens TaxID=1820333 RepID=A0A6L6J7N1_9RHOB|nr:hypothetical protein [Paracoccus aestuariivivens]MTH77178.1 hypothetical protein [Paracoccus aestuariivivens]